MSPEEASRHLQVFTATRCERAFRKLTEGHAALVYSTALRVVQGDAALAEDVVQMVFSGLAAKPHTVRDGKALAAWLHRAALGRAADAVRVESRRRKREELSIHMTPPVHSDAESADLWEQASPVIDAAMDGLPETERRFLVLRYWQRQDLQTIGRAFGLTDNAVQKRISRALEKLRCILSRRGIRSTTAAVSAAMLGAATSAPSSAAIAGISASSLALAGTTAATSSSILTEIIAMTAKYKVAVTGAAALVAIGAPAYLQHQQVKRLQAELDSLHAPGAASRQAQEIRRLKGEVARMTKEKRQAESPSGLAESQAEVARLTEQLRKQQEDSGIVASVGKGAPRSGALTTAGIDEASVTLSSTLDLLNDTVAEFSPVLANGKVQWDHGQATGSPDTETAGDRPTAWAPKTPKSGEQWLQLGYRKAVELKEINIHESHSPGAVSKVAAMMPDGTEKILWQGTAATAGGDEIIESSIPIPPGTTSNQIKVYVDTNRVESWPEIDAVEMVGTDGSKQWASESSASSSYSESYNSNQRAGTVEGLRSGSAVGTVFPGRLDGAASAP